MESTVLIAAKQEYTEQLYDILTENLINIMRETWHSVKDSPQPLRTFQKKLCDVPEWNNQVIMKHYETIIQQDDISSEYLEKIIEAVFLSNIKILSVVKLESKKQTIDIKIPDTKNFVHKCLIQLARELYIDPHLIDDRETYYNSKFEIQRNYKRIVKLTKESIEKTIRNMIPMKEILDKYLQAHDDVSIHSDENIEFAEEPEFEPQPPSQPPREQAYYQQQPQEAQQVPYQQEAPEPVPQEQNVDQIFMEPPSAPEPQRDAPPIRVNIAEEERNFFSDEEE